MFFITIEYEPILEHMVLYLETYLCGAYCVDLPHVVSSIFVFHKERKNLHYYFTGYIRRFILIPKFYVKNLLLTFSKIPLPIFFVTGYSCLGRDSIRLFCGILDFFFVDRIYISRNYFRFSSNWFIWISHRTANVFIPFSLILWTMYVTSFFFYLLILFPLFSALSGNALFLT